MHYNYIVTPIVGAIIGYTTNWIAIKMLFRPYTEKRIMGIKVPFTPGLIPNERERIALAMGEVIEEYLLTEEVLLNELTSESVDKIILSFFDEESHLQDDRLNFSFFFQNNEEMIQLTNFINQLIWDKINDAISHNTFKTNMVSLIQSRLTEVLNESSIAKIATNHPTLINELISNLILSDNSKNLIIREIENVLDANKSIKELFGTDFLDLINQLMKHNEPKIKKGIVDLVKSEQFAEQGKDMITSVISNKFGALGAMFVNPTSIYDSIVQTIEEKIESTDMAELIFAYMSQIFEHQLSEYIQETSKRSMATLISNRVLSEELLKKVHAYILDMDQSLYQLADTLFKGSFNESLGLFSEAIYDYMIKYIEDSKNDIKEWTRSMIEGTLNTPIALSKANKEKISQKVLAVYHMIIRKYITKFIASAKLSKIIEKQINTFEIEMFEEVILAIAKKELRAITWLGGLLGFVMSIVILLFNLIK